jgi:hypothetical protein
MTFKRWIGWLLALGVAVASPSSHAAPGEASLKFAQAQNVTPAPAAPAAPTVPPAAPATSAAPAAIPPASIGTVVTLQGNATATRNGASSALKVNDEIFKGDALKTSANSALGVIFDDETTFNLRANASITVDDFVYQDGSSKNAAVFDVVAGTVAFVASAVAKTGDMKITTPVSTLGIRGTTGLVEVGPSAAGAVTDNIKLYPDADGRVGRIEIRGRDGTSLGVLTRGATGFAIRGGAGLRPTALALQISPQQVARDRLIVQQIHQAQSAGRNIVAQRRLRQSGAPVPQPQQQRPQQLRPQPSPTPQRPTQPNQNLPRQNLRTQTPAAPGLQPRPPQPQPPLRTQQPQPLPQQQLRTPQRLPQQPALQRQRPASRVAVPPGRKPAAAPQQKKKRNPNDR